MRKIHAFATASILALTTAASSSAFAALSIASCGPYIGAGLSAIIAVKDGNKSAVDPGASLELGYRFNHNLAVETSYTGFLEAFATGKIVDLTVKGFLPVTPQLSLFGKIGAAYFGLDVNFFFLHHSKSVVAPEIGGGLEYNFSRNLATELGISAIPIGSGIVAMPVTLGVRYTFG